MWRWIWQIVCGSLIVRQQWWGGGLHTLWILWSERHNLWFNGIKKKELANLYNYNWWLCTNTHVQTTCILHNRRPLRQTPESSLTLSLERIYFSQQWIIGSSKSRTGLLLVASCMCVSIALEKIWTVASSGYLRGIIHGVFLQLSDLFTLLVDIKCLLVHLCHN